MLEAARRAGAPLPMLGLLGGDLARTLGSQGDEARMRSSDAMTFSLDVGEAVIDGVTRLFVAHLIARGRTWRRVFAACNAQFLDRWNVAPRAHPNDGLLDCFDCRVPVGDMWKIKRRLPLGTHLPHPGIKESRVPAAHVELERPLPVWLDGERVTVGRTISVRVETDALRVVV